MGFHCTFECPTVFTCSTSVAAIENHRTIQASLAAATEFVIGDWSMNPLLHEFGLRDERCVRYVNKLPFQALESSSLVLAVSHRQQ